MPVRRYSSAFQPKWVNSRDSPRASLTRSRTRIPASMTSGPMPSPGTTAIFVMGRELYVRGRGQPDSAGFQLGAQAGIAQRACLRFPFVAPTVVSADSYAGMRDQLGHAVNMVQQRNDVAEMP